MTLIELTLDYHMVTNEPMLSNNAHVMFEDISDLRSILIQKYHACLNDGHD